jgi:hypothetical protein
MKSGIEHYTAETQPDPAQRFDEAVSAAQGLDAPGC